MQFGPTWARLRLITICAMLSLGWLAFAPSSTVATGHSVETACGATIDMPADATTTTLGWILVTQAPVGPIDSYGLGLMTGTLLQGIMGQPTLDSSLNVATHKEVTAPFAITWDGFVSNAAAPAADDPLILVPIAPIDLRAVLTSYNLLE